jgi:hypothetical protein
MPHFHAGFLMTTMEIGEVQVFGDEINRNHMHAQIISRDSSLRFLATAWRTRVRFPAGPGSFFLRHHVQTVSEPHVASYAMDTKSTFNESKEAGA